MHNIRTVQKAPPGATREMLFELDNEGDLDVASAVVRVYRSTNGTIANNDTEIAMATFPAPAGSSQSLSIDYPLPTFQSDFFYGVCVDFVLGETIGADNCSNGVVVNVHPANAPNLSASGATTDKAVVQVGAALQLSVQVANTGGIEGSGTLVLRKSNDSTIDPADEEVGPSTQVSAPPTLIQDWSFQASASPGTFWYGACVEDVDEEIDIADNCSNGVEVEVTTAAPATFQLSVVRAGSGGGLVESNPEAILCGGSCDAAFADGTTVDLMATSAPGSTFSGWGGDCSGTAGCTVLMSSDRTVVAQFSSGGAVPLAPDFLRSVSVSQSEISLAWNDNSSNEDGFRIERKLGLAGPWITLATLPPGRKVFTDGSVACGTSYAYRVWAFNAAGNSPRSNERRDETSACSSLMATFDVAPATVLAGQPVDFVDGSSGAPSSWLWDFGDGTTSTLQNPTHVFQTEGRFTVSLTVSDGQGNDVATRTVDVASPVPSAAFRFTPVSPTVGQAVRFVDQSSGLVASRSWDFGDGGTSSARNPSHVFARDGTYAVTLRVSDSAGNQDQTTRNLVIAEGASGVEFTSASYAVREGVAVEVEVRPGGNSAASRSVTVSIQEGSATAGSDFTASPLMQLSWPAGDRSVRRIVVPTRDDPRPEGSVPETFSLSLRSPVGQTLGARTVATVQILDNDFEVDAGVDFRRDRAAENGVVERNGRGGSAIAWQEPDGDGSGIFLQFFAADGVAGSQVVRVNQATRGEQTDPSIAWLPDGSLIVVWLDESSAGRQLDGAAVVGRFFAPDGLARGGEIHVSGPRDGGPLAPDVSSDDQGDILVGWQEDDGPKVRILRRNGGPLTPVRPLPEPTERTRRVDFDKTAGGDFVAVWRDPGVVGGLRAQRFDERARPLGDAFVVSASPQADVPSVAMDDSGSFVVAWEAPSAAAGLEVWAQRFGPDDAALTPLLLVNSETTGDQSSARVAVNANGDFAVSFESRPAASKGAAGEVAVVGRFFGPEGTALGEDVDVSGDLPQGELDAIDPELSLDEDDVATVIFTRRPADGPPTELVARTLRTSIGSSSCDPTQPRELCLGESSEAPRFKATAQWKTAKGTLGTAEASAVTSDSGYFWFFDEENIELLVKVLDGCVINGHYWVFAGGLTDVQVSVTVEDVLTGRSATYFNKEGSPFAPVQDTSALDCSPGPAARGFADPSSAQGPADRSEGPARLRRQRLAQAAERRASCDSPEELCLNESRYAVSVDWAEPGGDAGTATPVQLTDDTGTFWFFDEANLEIVVKVLDGCGVNGSFWVFAGGLTDVETTIRVRHRDTGEVEVYVNPQGEAFQPIQDVGAFACN